MNDELRPDVKFHEPKKRAAPKPVRVSESPDLKRLDPVLRQYGHSDRLALLIGAADALRPSLDDKERAILDWLLDDRPCTLSMLAKEIDITKGYASKLRGRVLDRLEKRMKSTPENCTKLIERGFEIEVNRDLAFRSELIRRGRVSED